MKNTDIDLVYLWCDGSDTNFVQQKNLLLQQYGANLEANRDCRFIQMDELKYSLRSVNMYMPWIHHIFIVTNNQTPKWLANHEKITIIDHSEIMPKSALPCFNSVALECCLHRIPNLAEHFIYANDDLFVGRRLRPDFFFNNEQKPIVRFIKIPDYSGPYGATLLTAIELIEHHFGVSYKGYHPHHNMDAYTKTMLRECEKKFPKLFNHTIHQPLRNESCLQRFIFSLYGLVTNIAVKKDVSITLFHRIMKKLRLACVDSLILSMLDNTPHEMVNRYRAALYCLNDTEFTTDVARERALDFLKKRYPHKSPYEKDS